MTFPFLQLSPAGLVWLLAGAGCAVLALLAVAAARMRATVRRLERALSEHVEAEALQAGQKHLLELIAHGKGIDDVLETLAGLAEGYAPGLSAAALLLDTPGTTFARCIAPSLPAAFAGRLLSRPLDESVPGVAVRRGRTTLVGDVEGDPRCERCREARRHGFHAAWAAPIFTHDRTILGAFVLYAPAPGPPTRRERRLLEAYAQIAGIALQRDRTERARRDAETQFRRLLHSVEDVVWAVTPDRDRMHYINPAVRHVFGREPEAFLQDPRLWDRTIHPDDRDRVLAAADTLSEEDQTEMEYRIVRPDASVRWVHDRRSIVRDAEGRVVLVGGIASDVTGRRRAEEALQQALDRQRELTELKTRFVSMASHEMRTPLATIRSAAELVARFHTRWDAEKIEQHLGRIERNVRHMTELLEDVLFLGQVDAGRQAFEPEPLDVAAFVEELVDEVRLGVGARHVLHTAVALPAAAVRADRRLLRTILLNLLSNAVKYSDEGETVRLEVRGGPGADVRFIVSDEGIGIPEADLAHLFEPFHRAPNVGTRGGSGLGLTIVKRSVDLHGGRIDVESTLGRGTVVAVALPLPQAPAPPRDAGPRAQRVGSQT